MNQGRQKPLTKSEIDTMAFSPQDIAEAIARKRAREGLTMKQVAIETGVSPETVSNYESGEFPLAAARVLSWIYRGGFDVALKTRAKRAEEALRAIGMELAHYEGARK